MSSFLFQAVCQVILRALRTLLDEFAPLSGELAQLVGKMYNTVPHCCILPIAKQVNNFIS